MKDVNSNRKLIFRNYFSLWGMLLFWASFFIREVGSQYFAYDVYKDCNSNCVDQSFKCPVMTCTPTLVVPAWVYIVASSIFLLSLVFAAIGLISAIRSVVVVKKNKNKNKNKNINKRSFIVSISTAFLSALIHFGGIVLMLSLF